MTEKSQWVHCIQIFSNTSLGQFISVKVNFRNLRIVGLLRGLRHHVNSARKTCAVFAQYFLGLSGPSDTRMFGFYPPDRRHVDVRIMQIFFGHNFESNHLCQNHCDRSRSKCFLSIKSCVWMWESDLEF